MTIATQNNKSGGHNSIARFTEDNKKGFESADSLGNVPSGTWQKYAKNGLAKLQPNKKPVTSREARELGLTGSNQVLLRSVDVKFIEVRIYGLYPANDNLQFRIDRTFYHLDGKIYFTELDHDRPVSTAATFEILDGGNDGKRLGPTDIKHGYIVSIASEDNLSQQPTRRELLAFGIKHGTVFVGFWLDEKTGLYSIDANELHQSRSQSQLSVLSRVFDIALQHNQTAIFDCASGLNITIADCKTGESVTGGVTYLRFQCRGLNFELAYEGKESLNQLQTA